MTNKYGAIPSILTSVRISPEFYEVCKKFNIKFSEAMRVGISLLLAEKGIRDYDNNLNLVRQRTLAQEKLREVSQKYFDLLEKTTTDTSKPQDETSDKEEGE